MVVLLVVVDDGDLSCLGSAALSSGVATFLSHARRIVRGVSVEPFLRRKRFPVAALYLALSRAISAASVWPFWPFLRGGGAVIFW